MKKLALNVIVLGVIGTAFGLTSCNLFGSKETKTETEVKNDTITTIEDSVKIDSVTMISLEKYGAIDGFNCILLYLLLKQNIILKLIVKLLYSE